VHKSVRGVCLLGLLSGLLLRVERKRKESESRTVGRMESSKEEVAQNQLESRERETAVKVRASQVRRRGIKSSVRDRENS